MNTQDVEIVDEEVNAIRNVCHYLRKTNEKIDDLPVGIKQDLETASKWANDVIIGADVPF
jgi:hypothetical protein